MAEENKDVQTEVQTTKNTEKKGMSDKTRYILLGCALGVLAVAVVLACVFLT
ncbi:MAG: hypothetical protein J6C13_01210 [Clostridia bacterium]|nr:hypothetical protein [Clostridia bacterium]